MAAESQTTQWVRIIVEASQAAVDGISDAMLSSCRGVEEQRDGTEARLIAYLPPGQDPERAVGHIRERLEALRAAGLEVGKGRVTVRRVCSHTWEEAAKAGLEVVRVAPRIAVKPTWKDYVPAPGEVVIELDSGMAFGTGDHATTRGCLAALGRYVFSGATVFDIGAGSGILAIAAAKLGARRVIGIEIDQAAARIAAHHVTLNQVTDLVGIVCGEGLRCIAGSADIIVANLTSHDIVTLAPEAAHHLARPGIFITSGIAAAHFSNVRAAVEAAGFSLREQQRKHEWVTAVWEAEGRAPTAD